MVSTAIPFLLSLFPPPSGPSWDRCLGTTSELLLESRSCGRNDNNHKMNVFGSEGRNSQKNS